MTYAFLSGWFDALASPVWLIGLAVVIGICAVVMGANQPPDTERRFAPVVITALLIWLLLTPMVSAMSDSLLNSG